MFDRRLHARHGTSEVQQHADWLEDNPLEERRPSLDLVEPGYPPLLQQLMLQSWADDPATRVTFADIVQRLAADADARAMQDPVAMNPPPWWSRQADSSRAALADVDLGSVEALGLLQQFYSTLDRRRVAVNSIQRVQNLAMWQRYAAYRLTVLQRLAGNPYLTPERVHLFHGTKQDIAGKIVQQGCNRSFCGRNATASPPPPKQNKTN